MNEQEIKVLDLFSGIGGFSLGLKRAGGFRTVAYCEIEKACRETLAHHARQGGLDVAPIWDDVGTLPRFGGVDLVTAGWPCQGNSIAGKREGMQDARSGLWGEVIRSLRDFRPQFFLGENVPGLFSVNGGRDFLQCLRDLEELGYGVCWRVLDAQFFGVPQRRRRVFVVGHLGGVCPPEILLESESGKGNPSQGGKAGKDVAFSLRANPSRSGDKGDGGINCTMIAGTLKGGSGNRGWESGAETVDKLVARPLNSGGNLRHREDMDTLIAQERRIVSQAMSAKWSKGSSGPAGDEHHNLVVGPLRTNAYNNSDPTMEVQQLVTHSLTGEGHDASEDGTGRGTPLVPLDFRQTSRGDKLTNKRSTGSGGPPGSGVGNEGDPAFTVSGRQQGVGAEVGVRRLTPTECERLQGFPDHWTFGADSKRYKALGNAVAVPVIEWIGRRLARFGHKEGHE